MVGRARVEHVSRAVLGPVQPGGFPSRKAGGLRRPGSHTPRLPRACIEAAMPPSTHCLQTSVRDGRVPLVHGEEVRQGRPTGAAPKGLLCLGAALTADREVMPAM